MRPSCVVVAVEPAEHDDGLEAAGGEGERVQREGVRAVGRPHGHRDATRRPTRGTTTLSLHP